MPEVETFFSDVRRLVDAKLHNLVPSDSAPPTRLYQAIRWSLFGEGKRFRPALVIAAGREFGAQDNMLLCTAAAVEMVHTYSLIHDDLPAMDDDDLRRGRATAHKKFDEATAILAGDALQAMAFETIANDKSLSEPLRLKLVSELANAAGQMVSGQQMDLEAEGKSLDIGDIERIHRGKTGALISFSVRAGGLIAGTENDDLAALTEFGKNLGLLFQITDDLLDVTQPSERLGKTAGKDIAARKATYPAVYGIDESKILASELHSRTLSSLERVDSAALLLRPIADYILMRTS